LLAGAPTRVVSMPSIELFAEQDRVFRDEVLPPAVTARVPVEAAASFGWERWVGSAGAVIGPDRFGASAPAEVLFEELGLTPERVVVAVKDCL